MNRLAAAVAALTALVGCAHRAQLAPEPPAVCRGAANAGVVCVYRNQGAYFAAPRVQLAVDNKPLGPLENDTFARLVLPPGEHLLRAQNNNATMFAPSELMVVAQAGEVIIVRSEMVGTSTDRIVIPQLRKVPLSQGSEDIADDCTLDMTYP